MESLQKIKQQAINDVKNLDLMDLMWEDAQDAKATIIDIIEGIFLQIDPTAKSDMEICIANMRHIILA